MDGHSDGLAVSMQDLIDGFVELHAAELSPRGDSFTLQLLSCPIPDGFQLGLRH